MAKKDTYTNYTLSFSFGKKPLEERLKIESVIKAQPVDFLSHRCNHYIPPDSFLLHIYYTMRN